MKQNVALPWIVTCVLCSQFTMGKSAASEVLLPTLDACECQSNFANQNEISLSQYSDYIMTTATMYIITDKCGGTLDTTELERIFNNSNGEFRSADDNASFNPDFSNYTTVLPNSTLDIFSQYSCGNLKTGGSMETYCDHPRRSPFPNDGYIYLTNANQNKRKRIAAGLCDSIQSEWSYILQGMIDAYLDEDVVTGIVDTIPTTATAGDASQIKGTQTETVAPRIEDNSAKSALESTSKTQPAALVFALLVGLGMVVLLGVASICFIQKRNFSGDASSYGNKWDTRRHNVRWPNKDNHRNDCLFINLDKTCDSDSLDDDEPQFILDDDQHVTAVPGGRFLKNKLYSSVEFDDENEVTMATLLAATDNNAAEDTLTNENSLCLDDLSFFKESQQEKWATAIDPKSGNVYYYNKTTKETTWDAPVGFSVKEIV